MMKRIESYKVFGAIAIMGIAAAFLFACGERAKVDSRPAEEDNADEASHRTEIVDRENSSDQNSTGEKEWSEDEYNSLPGDKSLNDIRFADFQEKDWVDNEYIRTLRRYLDDFLCGNIEDELLEPYRKDLQGQFVVYSSQPFIGGGLFLQIVFIDKPENIFCVNVYSDVDMQREVVTGYRVQHMELAKEKNESTKEEMLQIMKEHPELKMW